MLNPYDPRFERKVADHGKRAIVGNVLRTAEMDWGVGGLQRQAPRFMHDDEKRDPVPHPYRRYPYKR